MRTLTVSPAYGRDYKSAAAAIADWQADKDFIAHPQGCYINRQQAVADGLTVFIRYNRMTRKVQAP